MWRLAAYAMVTAAACSCAQGAARGRRQAGYVYERPKIPFELGPGPTSTASSAAPAAGYAYTSPATTSAAAAGTVNIGYSTPSGASGSSSTAGVVQGGTSTAAPTYLPPAASAGAASAPSVGGATPAPASSVGGASTTGGTASTPAPQPTDLYLPPDATPPRPASTVSVSTPAPTYLPPFA